MENLVDDLLKLIDASPTPYHGVAEASRRLESAGYTALLESDRWALSTGDKRYFVRDQGSLVAFEVGSKSPADAGFRIVGAHTDSPNLRIKPCPDIETHGVHQLAVESYGGVLLHTWLDRDLSLAGRVTLREGSNLVTRLVDLKRALLRIPNLAIHLYRELKEEGLKLNAQKHLAPVCGLEGTPDLVQCVIEELSKNEKRSLAREDLLAFDLMAYDVQPASVVGAQSEFISAPRLDNLSSCYSSIRALLAASEPCERTRVVVLYDHEEVGSRSARGAGGPILADALSRITQAIDDDAQGVPRAMARSVLVSADMAHAIHPNYADRHESNHQPIIGKGPVIKVNSDLAYATESPTAGLFASLCAEVDVEPQYFVVRSDLRCGSTIGPISSARTGIPTVDVGNPMWAMHSCREIAGVSDVEPMIRVLGKFLE